MWTGAGTRVIAADYAAVKARFSASEIESICRGICKSVRETSMSSHEKVVAIIQARLGSTRLPGKSLMDVPWLAVVKAVYDRTAAAQGIDEL